MYHHDAQQEMQGLGFSLKLPDWARNIVSDVTQDVQAVKNLRLSVSTPGGPVSLTPAQALRIAQSARLSSGPVVPGPLQHVSDFVDSIPGGWLTVLVVGGGLAWLLLKRGRG